MKTLLKGEITIGLGVAITVGTIIATAITTYYTSLQATEAKIYDVKTTTIQNTEQILSIKESQAEMKESQKRLENKVDILLFREGVNPNNIK